MRHCPQCLTLFANHAQRCPDCSVDLVGGYPPLGRDRKRDRALVPVLRAANIFEAQRIAGMLDCAGIRATIIERRETVFGGDMDPLFRNTLGGGHWGEVCVLDYDAHRASALIAELRADDTPSSPVTDGAGQEADEGEPTE